MGWPACDWLLALSAAATGVGRATWRCEWWRDGLYGKRWRRPPWWPPWCGGGWALPHPSAVSIGLLAAAVAAPSRSRLARPPRYPARRGGRVLWQLALQWAAQGAKTPAPPPPPKQRRRTYHERVGSHSLTLFGGHPRRPASPAVLPLEDATGRHRHGRLCLHRRCRLAVARPRSGGHGSHPATTAPSTVVNRGEHKVPVPPLKGQLGAPHPTPSGGSPAPMVIMTMAGLGLGPRHPSRRPYRRLLLPLRTPRGQSGKINTNAQAAPLPGPGVPGQAPPRAEGPGAPGRRDPPPPFRLARGGRGGKLVSRRSCSRQDRGSPPLGEEPRAPWHGPPLADQGASVRPLLGAAAPPPPYRAPRGVITPRKNGQ